jgi:Ca2+-binding RTX toxin-like protein
MRWKEDLDNGATRYFGERTFSGTEASQLPNPESEGFAHFLMKSFVDVAASAFRNPLGGAVQILQTLSDLYDWTVNGEAPFGFDVPYSSWPGTDAPWDPATVLPDDPNGPPISFDPNLPSTDPSDYAVQETTTVRDGITYTTFRWTVEGSKFFDIELPLDSASAVTGEANVTVYDTAGQHSWESLSRSTTDGGEVTSKTYNYGRSEVTIDANGNTSISVDGILIDTGRQLAGTPQATNSMFAGSMSHWMHTTVELTNAAEWAYYLDVQAIMDMIGVSPISSINYSDYFYDSWDVANNYYDTLYGDEEALDGFFEWLIDRNDTGGSGGYFGGEPDDGDADVEFGPVTYIPAGPVVLDLDGDGVELTSLEDSAVWFNQDRDRFIEKTSWVGADDAFLVIDLAANGAAGSDGVINRADEVQFALWDSGAGSDLEAVGSVFDTNHDNVLNSSDARFAEFRIWKDANQNGVTDAGELLTLAAAGIASISLVSDNNSTRIAGNEVHGFSSFTRTDGSQGGVGDVALNYDPLGYYKLQSDWFPGYIMLDEANVAPLGYYSAMAYSLLVTRMQTQNSHSLESLSLSLMLEDVLFAALMSGQVGNYYNTGSGFVATRDFFRDIFVYVAPENSNGVTLSMGANMEVHYSSAIGSNGNDHIYAGSNDWVPLNISGGGGDDTLEGGQSADTLTGGVGSDILRGGDGDDVICFDTAIADNGPGVTLALGTSSIEIAYGGDGDDTIYTSGSLSVTIHGGGGADTLSGGSGADTLFGGEGDDRIAGGLGDDTLSGGEGDDTFVFASSFGKDIIVDFQAGAGTDDVLEFDNDVIADLASVLAASRQVGNDIRISLDAANEVLLKNVALTSLHQDDFRFV